MCPAGVTGGGRSGPKCTILLASCCQPVPRPYRPSRGKLTAVLLAFSLLPSGVRAGEPDLAEIRRYSQPLPGQEKLAGAVSFPDLRPSDWAWQALRNLVDRYGCVAGNGAGRFEGGVALSRFEAAALLHSCLPRVGEASDELKRLLASFGPELALLRGRMEGLESRVGQLEALRFSPTTKLSGLASTVVGANRFTGNGSGGAPAANADSGAFTFNYDVQLALNTSFSGKDLLYLNLRAGNFADTPFGGFGATGPLSTLEIAFQEICGNLADCSDVVAIDRLLYRWPVGAGFTAVFGARAGQEDMLPLWPSVYPSSTVLNVFTANGAPVAWNLNQGAGAGLWWEGGGLSLAANYVAANGFGGNPSQGGIGTVGAGASGSLQLGYTNKTWNLAAIWTRLQGGVESAGGTPFTMAQGLDTGAHTDAYGLAGSWQPATAGWVPSVSVGWGYNLTHNAPPVDAGLLSISQSWMVGLQWQDVLGPGNAFGMAVGQPVFATALTGGQVPDDGGLMMEAWYKLQITDAISVAPALFWLSRPLGLETAAGGSLGQLGALVRTAFAF